MPKFEILLRVEIEAEHLDAAQDFGFELMSHLADTFNDDGSLDNAMTMVVQPEETSDDTQNRG